MRARDDRPRALRRPPVSPPPRGSLGLPAPLASTASATGPRRRKERLGREDLGEDTRGEGSWGCVAPAHRSIFLHTHPGRNAPKRSGSGAEGWGAGWLISAGQRGKVNHITLILRHPTPGIQRKDPACKDAANVSLEAEAKRAARAERPRSWAAPEP